MHRKIGILGGLSPESTITYYEYITRTYYERFGDYRFPEILIYSVNFQTYVDWQREGRWEEAGRAMAEALNRLHQAGADYLAFGINGCICFKGIWRATNSANLSVLNEQVLFPINVVSRINEASIHYFDSICLAHHFFAPGLLVLMAMDITAMRTAIPKLTWPSAGF